MRTFLVPDVLRNGLAAGSLALMIAAPLTAAESASSVAFVSRDALTAGDSANGQQNPLRAGSQFGSAAPSNTLRDGVAQVSYETGVPAEPRKLDQAAMNQSKGVLSGFLAKPKAPTNVEQTAANMPAKQPAFRAAAKKTKGRPLAAAQQSQAMNFLPTFQSTSARRTAQAATSQASSSQSRSGQAQHAQAAPQRVANRPTNQPSYNQPTSNQPSYNSAAAAAQNYRPAPATMNQQQPAAYSQSARPGLTPNGQRTVWNHQTSEAIQQRIAPQGAPLSRPTLAEAPRAAVARPVHSGQPTHLEQTAHHEQPLQGGQPMPGPQTAGPAPNSPAGILSEAHRISTTARSDADFTKILALCQKVPARTATPEETVFGRQLAAWALNRRGQLRARAGKTDAAKADFDQAIRIDPKCWRALHNRGVLAAQAGQFEPAFDDFHHTIELNPTFAKAYANRGALYVLAGEMEPALADYEKAAELDPKFAVAHRGCGRVCHILGRTDEALEHLSQAIELAPHDAAAVASRGDLLTDLGDYEGATEDYEYALSIDPKFADACRGSAWLLATCPEQSIRDPKLALERAKLAAELDQKGDAATYDTLAAAQASAGDFKAAAESIQHAIELASPSERSVYQDRMQLYRQSKPFRIEPIQAVQQAGFEQ